MSNHCDCHCDHDHEAQHGHNHINRYEEAFALFDLHLHDENVTAAVRRLIDEKSAQYRTDEATRQLLAAIELTTLRVTDSQESVLAFPERVNRFADAHPDLPHFATLCVYPNFARIVSESLEV